jgi:hypothetical protein
MHAVGYSKGSGVLCALMSHPAELFEAVLRGIYLNENASSFMWKFIATVVFSFK